MPLDWLRRMGSRASRFTLARDDRLCRARQSIIPLIPAKAGIQLTLNWVPAFAGTSGWNEGRVPGFFPPISS